MWPPVLTRLRLQVKVNFKSIRSVERDLRVRLYTSSAHMSELMTITEVTRRGGVASSALRFYESRGLITSERTGSGHRRFARAVLRRVAFIVFAQKIGLSLDEVAVELSRLPHNRVPERADWG